MAELEQRKRNAKKIESYRDLAAWQKARQLVREIYALTASFPREEVYGLTNQLRRAAVSVASNIAEGYGRGSLGDYIRFLQTARGSLFEMETQTILSSDLNFTDPQRAAAVLSLCDECARILQGLIASLKSKAN